ACGLLLGLNLLIGAVVAWGSAVWTWLPGTIVYVPIWFLIHARSDYAAMGPSARAFGAAWLTVVALTAVIVASLGAATVGSGVVYANIWPSIASALYGGAWMTAAVIRGKGRFGGIAAGCFATAIACAWLIGTPQMLMVFGAALLAFVAAPGFILMR